VAGLDAKVAAMKDCTVLLSEVFDALRLHQVSLIIQII